MGARCKWNRCTSHGENRAAFPVTRKRSASRRLGSRVNFRGSPGGGEERIGINPRAAKRIGPPSPVLCRSFPVGSSPFALCCSPRATHAPVACRFGLISLSRVPNARCGCPLTTVTCRADLLRTRLVLETNDFGLLVDRSDGHAPETWGTHGSQRVHA